MEYIERRIAQQSDDCYRNLVTSDLFQLDSADFLAGRASSAAAAQGSAGRFRPMLIPRGSAIYNARLALTGSQARTGVTVNTRLRCQAHDNPPGFTDLAEFDARVWTANRVDWDGIGSWNIGDDILSPNIAACVQEVINRPGWIPGNPIVVLWDDFEQRSTQMMNRNRVAHSFTSDPALAPRLIVEFSVPGVGLFDRFGRPKRQEAFDGAGFCWVNVAATDAPRQITPGAVKLRDVIIQVQTNDQFLGDADAQHFRLDVGESVTMRNVDLATLFARNAVAGNNGTVVVFGTRE